MGCRLLQEDSVQIRYDQLWSGGAYVTRSGEVLAEFRSCSGVVEITETEGETAGVSDVHVHDVA